MSNEGQNGIHRRSVLNFRKLIEDLPARNQHSKAQKTWCTSDVRQMKPYVHKK
jgi:hypothetical protein